MPCLREKCLLPFLASISMQFRKLSLNEMDNCLSSDPDSASRTFTAPALSELLVEGRLSSFSDMSYSIKEFFRVSEKVFLMFIQSMPGAELEVLRYEYERYNAADMYFFGKRAVNLLWTASFSRDLLWNLQKKPEALFQPAPELVQASHPEVYVQYEVGMGDTAVKEEADAINRLNTELMAGNGPDVLVLNGLPWESYQEKEILGDFSGCLRTSIKEGDMFVQSFF